MWKWTTVFVKNTQMITDWGGVVREQLALMEKERIVIRCIILMGAGNLITSVIPQIAAVVPIGGNA